MPEWYKNSKIKIDKVGYKETELNINNTSSVNVTYKMCVPFLDAMTSGYVVTTEYDVEISEINGYPAALWRTNKKELISGHDDVQWEGMPCPDGYFPQMLKFDNELVIETPKEYSVLFTAPFNRPDLPFYCFSGIVDTDKYPMPVHFPFFIKKGFVGIIEKGTPVIQIIPFKREEWQIDNKDYSEKYSYTAQESLMSKIRRSYRDQFWSKKTYR